MQLRIFLVVTVINVACLGSLFCLLNGKAETAALEHVSFTLPKPKQAQCGNAVVANGLTVQGSGWKTVAHYLGNTSEFTDHFQNKSVKWVSQVKQDKTIASIFNQSKGLFFVDLAANEADVNSNTFALEQVLNWRGLCIEINPRYLPKLTQRKCHLAVAAVGRSTGDTATFNFQDGLGGIVGEQFDQKTTKRTVKASKVPLVSIDKIFSDFAVPNVIDYLSLDIEGAELYAFELFPWHRYKFLTMTVERPKKLQQVLERNDYVYVRDHGTFGDKLFIHKTLPNFNWVMETFGTKCQEWDSLCQECAKSGTRCESPTAK